METYQGYYAPHGFAALNLGVGLGSQEPAACAGDQLIEVQREELELPEQVWEHLVSHVKEMSDVWALTATCKAAYQARNSPTCLSSWLVHHRPRRPINSALHCLRNKLDLLYPVLEGCLALGADPNGLAEPGEEVVGLAPYYEVYAVSSSDTGPCQRHATDDAGSGARAGGDEYSHSQSVFDPVCSADTHGTGSHALVAASTMTTPNVMSSSAVPAFVPPRLKQRCDPPLMFACELDLLPVIRMLLDAGACVAVREVATHRTLLHAARSGAIAAALIAAGADIHATNSSGATPLYTACECGAADVALALLAAGSSATRGTPSGNDPSRSCTPLHVVAGPRADELVPALVAAGGDVEALAKHGWTPLHMAAFFGRQVSVRALLAAGARAAVWSEAGYTPIELAAEEEWWGVVAMLEEHAAAEKERAQRQAEAAAAAAAAAARAVQQAEELAFKALQEEGLDDDHGDHGDGGCGAVHETRQQSKQVHATGAGAGGVSGDGDSGQSEPPVNKDASLWADEDDADLLNDLVPGFKVVV